VSLHGLVLLSLHGLEATQDTMLTMLQHTTQVYHQ
jgi:hypothetical protein